MTALRIEDLQQREEHWIIADLVGKGRHIRSVPVPSWVKKAIDEWTQAASIQTGPLLRPINKGQKIGESGFSPKVIWGVVKRIAATCDLKVIAPHDLRSSCAVYVIRLAGSWNRFNFCWATFRFKRRNGIWDANSASITRSTIASASNLLNPKSKEAGRRSDFRLLLFTEKHVAQLSR